jgi:hypothetical protein
MYREQAVLSSFNVANCNCVEESGVSFHKAA